MVILCNLDTLESTAETLTPRETNSDISQDLFSGGGRYYVINKRISCLASFLGTRGWADKEDTIFIYLVLSGIWEFAC